jgi:hypothetical protein
MRTDEAARAAELAHESGFVTADQLRQAKFDVDLARREVAAGRWQGPVRGFYVPNVRPLEDATLARIAAAHGGKDALLTGLIAARALNMRWIPDLPGAQVLVPPEVRRRSWTLVGVRRCAAARRMTSWSWGGVRVAPPERIVLDLGLTVQNLQDVRGVVLGAVHDRWTTPGELTALLEREPRNGTALLRRAISNAAEGSVSPPEAELVDEMRGCGMPFLLNPELRRNGELLGYLDGYFVGLGAGWEVDSRERHDGDKSFDETLGRHTRLAGHGLMLAHPTPRQIRRDGPGTAAAVLAVAKARLLLPVALREPRDLVVVPRGPILR